MLGLKKQSFKTRLTRKAIYGIHSFYYITGNEQIQDLHEHRGESPRI